MSIFSEFNIDSGVGLKRFIESSGLIVEHTYQLDKNSNCIFLPDKSSFNWKDSLEKIRFNCKEEAKDLIEKNTELLSFDNSKSDKTRPYSFWIENLSELIDVISILKKYELNAR